MALAGTCQAPCFGLGVTDRESARRPASVDSTAGSATLSGQRGWSFQLGNTYAGNGQATNAAISVSSGYGPSLFDAGCSGTAVGSFPYVSSQGVLAAGQSLSTDLCSTIPVTFAPGFDSGRSMTPLLIPAGGGQQSVAVTVALTDPAMCRTGGGSPECGFGGQVLAAGPAGASVASITGPANLDQGESFQADPSSGPGVSWNLNGPVLSKRYTVTVVLNLPNLGSPYSFKPVVDLNLGDSGPHGCQVDVCGGPATSVSIADPTLDGPTAGSGRITFSADQSRLWDQGGPPTTTRVHYTGLQQSPPEPYNPVVPARVLDTRSGLGGSTIGGGQSINVAVAGKGGVPAGSAGVVLNVTVTNTSAGGFLTIWPAGGTRPLASSLNFSAGQTIPNLIEVALGTGGAVSIFNSAGSTDVLADVQGYTGPASKPGAGLFTAVTPSRLLDTRAGGTLGPGGQTDLGVLGVGAVPSAGVSGVVLNVTVTNPSAGGYLTVWPSGAARPLASNLNFTAGLTIPNRVEVQVGTGGKVSIFNFMGTADVIVDVNGWYSDGSGTPPAVGNFTGVTPARLLDTRSSGSLGPGGVQNLTVTGGPAGLPTSGVTAVVLNVTVTNPSASGYLTVWPAGGTRPTASDLNFSPGQTIPNLVVVGVSSSGAISIFNFAGTSDVIVDIAGWYS